MTSPDSDLARPLTIEEIQEGLQTVFSNTRYNTGNNPESSLRIIQMKVDLTRKLMKVQVRPSRIRFYFWMLHQQHINSQVAPGTLIGLKAAMAAAHAATQNTLNAIHGGSKKGMNAGFPRLEELMNCTQNPKHPMSRIAFRERLTAEEVLERQANFVETTFSKLVKDYNVMDIPEEDPEWLEDFLDIYDIDLPETNLVLKLTMKTYEMYMAGFTPGKLRNILTDLYGDLITVVYSPFTPVGNDFMVTFWIYPVEERMIEEAREKLRKMNIDDTAVTESRFVRFFLENVVVGVHLRKLLIRGIQGITDIEPVENPLFPTPDPFHWLCKARMVTPDEDLTPRWEVFFNLPQMFFTGVNVDDILKSFQALDATGNFNFEAKVRKQILLVPDLPEVDEVLDALPSRLRSSVIDTEVKAGIEIQVNVGKMVSRGFEHSFILTQLGQRNIPILDFQETRILVKEDPSSIPGFIRKEQRENPKSDLVRDTIFVTANTFGENQKILIKHPDIVPELTYSNNQHVFASQFGIEGAYLFTVREIHEVAMNSDMGISPHMVPLYASAFTRMGFLTGATYYGLARQDQGPFSLASFEQASKVLQTRAVFGAEETTANPSVSLFTGQPATVGTNMAKMVSTDPMAIRAALAGRKTKPRPQVAGAPSKVIPIEVEAPEKPEIEDENPDTQLVSGMGSVIGEALEEIATGQPTPSAEKPVRRSGLKIKKLETRDKSPPQSAEPRGQRREQRRLTVKKESETKEGETPVQRRQQKRK